MLNRNHETIVPDLFIALKVHDDVWVDKSKLHLSQPEAFRDLFNLMQPQARLEARGPPLYLPRPFASRPHRIQHHVRSEGASVSFGPSHRTIVNVEREKDERLVVAAKRLTRKLKPERQDDDVTKYLEFDSYVYLALTAVELISAVIGCHPRAD